MLRPMKKKTAAATAHELWQIFSIIGIPKILQSDNGTEFLNETIRALTSKLGVPHRFISEYNPRADGKVERVVRTVKQTVSKLLKGASVIGCGLGHARRGCYCMDGDGPRSSWPISLSTGNHVRAEATTGTGGEGHEGPIT